MEREHRFPFSSTAAAQNENSKVSMDITGIPRAVGLVGFRLTDLAAVSGHLSHRAAPVSSTLKKNRSSCGAYLYLGTHSENTLLHWNDKKTWKTTFHWTTGVDGQLNPKLKDSWPCSLLGIFGYSFNCKGTTLKSTPGGMVVCICIPSKGNGVEYLHPRQWLF